MPSGEEQLSKHFRDRALWEARRYGADAYVFVRELLQNARDAFATKISIDVEGKDDGRITVSVRDDGTGMTFDHARRFLFRLYASSKVSADQAGRFGVGFWSCLRFDPTRIIVRSQPEHGQGWEVSLSGDLAQVDYQPVACDRGTSVVLERIDSDLPGVRSSILGALARDARLLATRRGTPIAIEVDGTPVPWARHLPPPCARFARGGVKGEVALGPVAQVELFSKGLLLRRTACLRDLLSPSSRGDEDPDLPALDRALPRAVLHADGLEPLLARATLRETKRLRRVVRIAEKELTTLVRKRVDRARPRNLRERAADALAAVLGPMRRLAGRIPKGAMAALAATVLVIAGSLLLAPRSRKPIEAPPPAAPPARASAPGVVLTPYSDISSAYHGPEANEADDLSHDAVALHYSPESESPLFAALICNRDDLRPGASPSQQLHPYVGSPCHDGCLDVALQMRGNPGLFRLPVPTGHRLDVRSVTLLSEPVDAQAILATEVEEPAILLPQTTVGELRYRTVPAPSPLTKAHPRAATASLRDLERGLDRLPAQERISAALERVRERVSYDLSPETARRHREAADQGLDLVDRTLLVGAGDCDVLNALLVTVLGDVGVPARLAVGFTGERGLAVPGLHAWTEIQDAIGFWHPIDASAGPVLLYDGSRGIASEPLPMPVVVASPPDASPVAARGSRPLAVLLLLLFLAPLPLLHVARRGDRRSVVLGEGDDIAPLLRAALEEPLAFGHLGPLTTRRLIPLTDGRALSLARARALGAKRRLFASGSAALRAGRGAAILDLERDEGRLVATALSAQDLDRFQALLSRSRSTESTRALEDRLRRDGLSVTLRACEGLRAPELATLDLEALGTSMEGLAKRTFVVLLSPDDPILPIVPAAEEALFTAIDEIASRVGLMAGRRRRLLSAAARRAVAQAAR